MSPATPVPLPLLLLEIRAPGSVRLVPCMRKLPPTVSVILPPLPPPLVFSARIKLPACIVISPPTLMSMGEALLGGTPASLQLMLPVR